MNCPNCKNDLIENHVDVYKVFSCETCSGLWVSGAQIKRVLREKGMPPSMNATPVMFEGGARPETKRDCPTCLGSELTAIALKVLKLTFVKLVREYISIQMNSRKYFGAKKNQQVLRLQNIRH